MNEVFQILCSKLDYPVRTRISRRIERMMRNIQYLEEHNHRDIRLVRRDGWGMRELEILCTLTAFYQTVIGPLAASSRGHLECGLGSRAEIQYGTQIRVDASHREKVAACDTAFSMILVDLGIDRRWLYAYRAQDLVYQLARSIEYRDA